MSHDAEQLVEPMERRFGTGPLAVTVRGWAMTLRGHILYCQNCPDLLDE